MFCKHCGHELSENDKFCSYCGQPVESPEEKTGTNPDFQIPHIEEPEMISQPVIMDIAKKPVFLVFTIAYTVMLASFAFSVLGGAFLSVLPLIFGIFVDIALWTLYGLAKNENENENPGLFNKIRSYATCQKVFAIIAIVGISLALAASLISLAGISGVRTEFDKFDISSADGMKNAISDFLEKDGSDFVVIYGNIDYEDAIDELYENEAIADFLALGVTKILLIVMGVLTVVLAFLLAVEIISAIRYKKMALFCDDLRLSWVSGVPMRGAHDGLRKLSIVFGILRTIAVVNLILVSSVGTVLITGSSLLSNIVSIGEVVAIFAFASIVKELDGKMQEASENRAF